MFIEEKDFQGFVAGKEKAFETIFHQYYKTLVSFAMRYGLEQMEAEDVVIEVIHHIWEIRKDVKSSAALNVLFYTSVKNRTINVVRNLKNRQRLIGKQKPEEEEFYDHLLEEEVTRILYEAINTLPVQCREVISLLLAGNSVEEVAVKLNISNSSVRTYKARALERLRILLRNYPCLILMMIIRLMG